MKLKEKIVYQIFDKFRNQNPFKECSQCYNWETYQVPNTLKNSIQEFYDRTKNLKQTFILISFFEQEGKDWFYNFYETKRK